jgi:hypothetical protein
LTTARNMSLVAMFSGPRPPRYSDPHGNRQERLAAKKIAAKANKENKKGDK